MGPEKEIYGTYDLGVLSGTKPTLISKTNPTPETYQMQDFDMNAWVASVLKDRYGTDGSNRDFRRLNRYLTSLEGLKALSLAKANHRASEMLKYTSAQQKLKAAQNESNNQDTKRIDEKAIVRTMAPSLIAIAQSIKPKWTTTNANIKAGDQTYKIESGNTLGQIVSAYNKLNGTNLKWQDVAKWNGVDDEKKLKIGQVLKFKPNETTSPETNEVASTQTNLNTESTMSSTPTSNVRSAQTREEFDKIMTERGLVFDEATGMYRKPKTAITTNEPDSVLVSQADSGNVARGDSVLLESPDSVSIPSGLSVDTTRSPRNFTRTGLYFNYPTENFMRDMKLYRDHLKAIVPEKNISNNKQGGTMNRIKYFQQGGAAPAAQQGQADAFMQAILQGDPQTIAQLVEVANSGNEEAQQLILTILKEEQEGNPNVAKAAQVLKQILGQATSAKWGSKLQYIRSLKYAKGGKTCHECESKKVELKACGGKNKKKKYFGGGPFEEIEHGNIKVQTPTKYLGNESYGEKPKRVILKHNVASMPNDTLYFDNSRQLQEVLGSNSAKEGLHSEKTKDMYGTVDRWGNRNNSKTEIRFNQYLR